MSRNTIAVLSTENLINNLEVIKKEAPNSSILAVVKANAFGHGIRSTALRLAKYNVAFGVATIEEALILRKLNIYNDIFLLEGVSSIDELLIASCNQLSVVFHSSNQILWLNDCNLPLPLKAWLKIDTGMGRLGFAPAEAPALYQKLNSNPNIKSGIGLISHFSMADDSQHPHNQQQLKLMHQLAANWNGPKSFANSAAIFNYRESHFDMVRPGLALYGLSPLKNVPAMELGLKPVMTLQSSLMAIKDCEAGSFIGYGAKYQCTKPTKIGIIAIGYGDGYMRSLPSGTKVLVNNKLCQTVGSISMDMTTLDLSGCDDAKIGDPVILWGTGLPMEDMLPPNLISHELICNIQPRVKSAWTLNN